MGRWQHSFIDHYTVFLGAVFAGKRKFFSASIESPTIPELMRGVSLEIPEISGIGIFEVPADTPVGKLDTAFYVAQWLGPDCPTLIYHHGNNERPFDTGRYSKNTFDHIALQRRDEFAANLIVVRAPFHQDLRAYMDKITALQNFAAMLATSVQLIEALITRLYGQGCSDIVVSGISLGGWVTNIHRATFNSADLYLPLLAGAALDAVFLDSTYRKMTGALALDNPEQIRHVLNFEKDFAKIETDNVFPLLARYDPIIVYERQQRCYRPDTVTIVDRGHLTAALDDTSLRRFLLSHLKSSVVVSN